jgi:hypothetical protein
VTTGLATFAAREAVGREANQARSTIAQGSRAVGEKSNAMNGRKCREKHFSRLRLPGNVVERTSHFA